MKTKIQNVILTIIMITMGLTAILVSNHSNSLANSSDVQRLKVDALLREGIIEDYGPDLQRRESKEFGQKITNAPKANWKLPQSTFFTSYNPVRRQTDGSPCIGAHGTNLCEMAKDGIRTIAISQDLVGRAAWKQYHYGDKVMLYSSNPQCNGVFQIEDTMNPRYKNRGDIFCPTRDCNTNCLATITIL